MGAGEASTCPRGQLALEPQHPAVGAGPATSTVQQPKEHEPESAMEMLMCQRVPFSS